MNSKLIGIQLLLATGALAVLLAGCGSKESKAVETGDPLRSVSIPSDFTFAASRPVKVQIQVASSVIARAPLGVAGVQVELADGTVLYQGPVTADRPLELNVAVPSKDKQLQVTLLSGENKKTRATVSIENGSASQAFN